jgi:hypothetical protein
VRELGGIANKLGDAHQSDEPKLVPISLGHLSSTNDRFWRKADIGTLRVE